MRPPSIHRLQWIDTQIRAPIQPPSLPARRGPGRIVCEVHDPATFLAALLAAGQPCGAIGQPGCGNASWPVWGHFGRPISWEPGAKRSITHPMRDPLAIARVYRAMMPALDQDPTSGQDLRRPVLAEQAKNLAKQVREAQQLETETVGLVRAALAGQEEAKS